MPLVDALVAILRVRSVQGPGRAGPLRAPESSRPLSLRMTGLSWELAASLFGRATPVAHHDSAVMSFSLPDMPPSVAMATTKVGSAARRSR